MRTSAGVPASALYEAVKPAMDLDAFKIHLVHLHRKHELRRHRSTDPDSCGTLLYTKTEYLDAEHDHDTFCSSRDRLMSVSITRLTTPPPPEDSASIKQLARMMEWTDHRVSRIIKICHVEPVGKVDKANYYNKEQALTALRTYTPNKSNA